MWLAAHSNGLECRRRLGIECLEGGMWEGGDLPELGTQ